MMESRTVMKCAGMIIALRIVVTVDATSEEDLSGEARYWGGYSGLDTHDSHDPAGIATSMIYHCDQRWTANDQR